MTGLGIFFLVLSVIFMILFGLSVRLNYKLGIAILSMQDSVERSLDVLDERYQTMSGILETPVFFDSIEVRQVMNEISKCRESVLYVANELTAMGEEEKR